MKMFKAGRMLTVALGFALSVGAANANNLSITNVSVEGHGATTALVKFDISWDNSWRFAAGGDSLYFHDAAWVFFKVKMEGASDWQHVKLEGSGLNPPGFSIGSGTAIEMVVPADGAGMFVRRSSDGAGPVAVEQVTAVWNFAANGFSKNDKVKIQAMGIEMCYVAQGAFRVGDGLKDNGQLYEGGTGANPQPFVIAGAGAIQCGDATGKLWGASRSGNNSMGTQSSIPATFPNGYNAFYCMKYEASQGQYADFLNTLTSQQQQERCSASTVGRYMSDSNNNSTPSARQNIKVIAAPEGQPRVYATITPDIACGWLNWSDTIAFLDWAGLRPMTEFEYEKACRGPLAAIAGEYAWGTTAYTAISALQGEDGSGSEFYENGNLIYEDFNPGGPVRVGIFARSGSSREAAGASYWGIMELSGNLWERVVSIGSGAGLSFQGIHGDGALDVNGDADAGTWPGFNGAGCRGGNYNGSASYARVSDRHRAAFASNTRFGIFNCRAARTAP